MKEIKDSSKLTQQHGYLYFPRISQVLIKDLGFALFGFYMGLVGQVIWDKRKNSYGCINKTNFELGQFFVCHETTVSRNLKELENKGYLIKTPGQIKIVDFSLFEFQTARMLKCEHFTSAHELRERLQELRANFKEENAVLLDSKAENNESFNVSSRVESMFPSNEVIDPNEIPF